MDAVLACPESDRLIRTLRVIVLAAKVSFSPNELQSMLYLRKKAPPNAVIMSNKYRTASFYRSAALPEGPIFLSLEPM